MTLRRAGGLEEEGRGMKRQIVKIKTQMFSNDVPGVGRLEFGWGICPVCGDICATGKTEAHIIRNVHRGLRKHHGVKWAGRSKEGGPS